MELLTQISTTFATKEAQFLYPTTFTYLQTHVSAPLNLEHQTRLGKLLYGGLMGAVKFMRNYSKNLHEHRTLHLLSLYLRSSPATGLW